MYPVDLGMPLKTVGGTSVDMAGGYRRVRRKVWGTDPSAVRNESGQ